MRLTEEILLKFGFEIVGQDFLKRNIFQIKPNNYYYFIQIIIVPKYDEDNPNCGIILLFEPAGEAFGVPKDLCTKENWTDEYQKRADEYRIPYPEFCRPIVWGVDSVSRLFTAYEGLTGEKLNYEI